jgi:hypothetical protein
MAEPDELRPDERRPDEPRPDELRPDELRDDTGEVRAAVARHLAAVNALDAEAVAAGFAADAVFIAEEGEAVGQREVFTLFRDAFGELAAVDLQLRRIVVAGDTAACELAEAIQLRTGAALELQMAAFYTVVDGLITRVRVYRSLPG